MTTTNRPELKPVLNRFGKPVTADAGAAHQGQPRPIKACGACARYVVWVQNAAERWYLANVYQYRTDGPVETYYFRKDSPHRCEGQQPERLDTTSKYARHHIAEARTRIAHAPNADAARAIAWEVVNLADRLVADLGATDDDRAFAAAAKAEVAHLTVTGAARWREMIEDRLEAIADATRPEKVASIATRIVALADLLAEEGDDNDKAYAAEIKARFAEVTA